MYGIQKEGNKKIEKTALPINFVFNQIYSSEQPLLAIKKGIKRTNDYYKIVDHFLSCK